MDECLVLMAFVFALGMGAAVVEGLWPRLCAWWFKVFGGRRAEDWASEGRGAQRW